MRNPFEKKILSVVGLVSLMLAFQACVLTPSALKSGGAAQLWSIGRPDSNYAEFAVAGKHKLFQERFPGDVDFEVGHDKPAEAWPYVHPGPSDAWAGGRVHPFSIHFKAPRCSGAMCELRLAFVAGQGDAPPRYSVSVNGHERELQIAKGPGDPVLTDAKAGNPQVFSVFFHSSILKRTDNTIVLSATGGSWALFDSIQLFAGVRAPALTGLQIRPSSQYVHRAGQLGRPVEILFEGGAIYEGATLEASVEGRLVSTQIESAPLGVDRANLVLPVEAQGGAVEATFTLRSPKGQWETKAEIAPVRKWEVYLLHHTHLDIGYTHPQVEVEKKQMAFLDQAIELGRKTDDYPPEARFKWLPEGLWAVDSYLKAAPPEKRDAFIDAVKKNWIGLDALYGNALTGLYRPEELFELVGYARRLSKEYDLTIDSAMITDVPGYTWGLVPALAQSGVKYLSIGPNRGHRIGHTLSAWGDKPFYWLSPSGRERVLCWMAGEGYSWFHGDQAFGDFDPDAMQENRSIRKLLEYLERLEASDYPYDMVQLRYNIGGDNGPPDPNLPEVVKAWNARYAYPKLIIATTSEMFHEFEKRYGDALPEARGDFTPYWEDGAASTARETAINRRAAERIAQAGTLWSLLDPQRYPAAAIEAAWRQAILYDEHTWGAWNSISDPDSEFAKTQWAWKAQCAIDAGEKSEQLLNDAIRLRAAPAGPVEALDVFNTCSWPRTDLVILPAEMELVGSRVLDAEGQTVPSQRLASGALAFLASDVPALGARRYAVRAGLPKMEGAAMAAPGRLENDSLALAIDPESGAIGSLKATALGAELVDATSGPGLNEYVYVAGRDPMSQERVEGNVRISVRESGPLVASLAIESGAPGCESLEREVRLVAGLDYVDILDTLNRKQVRTPEGAHLAFPFHVPGGVVRMDTPWAVVRPGADQIEGACKNYFTVQRWADVSNDTLGVTLATLDAPLFEVGRITNDARAIGFLTDLPSSTTLYSYVMNNYWETNYKADQPGVTRFQYALRPHGPLDQAAAQRFGMERSQPLVAVPVAPNLPVTKPFGLQIAPGAIVVTALKPAREGQGWILRLFNTSAERRQALLSKPNGGQPPLWLSSPFEEKGAEIQGPIDMAPYDIVTLLAGALAP